MLAVPFPTTPGPLHVETDVLDLFIGKDGILVRILHGRC